MLYDQGSNTWPATGRLSTMPAYQTATLLPSSKVPITGGTDWEGKRAAGAELYSP